MDIFLATAICLAHPFSYDLNLSTYSDGKERTIVCFHGSGANYRIGERVLEMGVDANIISFNFPDYDLSEREVGLTTFGTIEELLPALYVLNEVAQNLEAIDLYGFSAGGGAVINTIAVLNSSRFDRELETIGIGAKEKEKLLSTIGNGTIFLDAPLKSVEEIIDFRGTNEDLEMIAKRYRENNLRPIDSLEGLNGLELDIHLYFQEFDEILSNRDDQLFVERLLQANQLGNTSIVIADEGGHLGLHRQLWTH